MRNMRKFLNWIHANKSLSKLAAQITWPPHFSPEDEGSMFLRNNGICAQFTRLYYPEEQHRYVIFSFAHIHDNFIRFSVVKGRKHRILAEITGVARDSR
jgi:hypothetical protein